MEKDEIVKKSLYAFMELRKRSYQFSQPKDTVSFFEDYKMDLNPTEVFAKESLIVIEGETDIKVFTEDFMKHLLISVLVIRLPFQNVLKW